MASLAGARALSLVLVLVGAVACDQPKRIGPLGVPVPDNVLLISIDTLRADHCGFMGYTKPTTPFLDSLAAQGVVFEHHMVNSNNTLVSHTSLLTGMNPLAHGVNDNDPKSRMALRRGFETLAEELAAAEYATASFTEHPVWLARDFGLDHGFETVVSGWVTAPETTERFLDWYDDEEPDRLFAFLHFYDVHSDWVAPHNTLPYTANPELIEQFAGPKPAGFTGCLKSRTDCCASEYLHALCAHEEPLPKEHLDYLVGLYDAGLRQFDDDLRALFAQLEERDLLDDTLIVITSDHGEAFMEHDQLLHNTYHDEIMHVPLLVVLPRGLNASAKRVDRVTQSIDVAPTILELCGLSPIGQGQSLAATLVKGETPRDGDVLFGSLTLRAKDDVSTYKFVNEYKHEFFFDLDHDPGETNNLWKDEAFRSRNAERLVKVEALLEKLRASSMKISDSMPEDGPLGDRSADSDAELRKLGYAGHEDDEESGKKPRKP